MFCKYLPTYDKASEQPSSRILGFFRARARASFRSSWSDRARAVTRAQLLNKIYAFFEKKRIHHYLTIVI